MKRRVIAIAIAGCAVLVCASPRGPVGSERSDASAPPRNDGGTLEEAGVERTDAHSPAFEDAGAEAADAGCVEDLATLDRWRFLARIPYRYGESFSLWAASSREFSFLISSTPVNPRVEETLVYEYKASDGCLHQSVVFRGNKVRTTPHLFHLPDGTALISNIVNLARDYDKGYWLDREGRLVEVFNSMFDHGPPRSVRMKDGSLLTLIELRGDGTCNGATLALQTRPGFTPKKECVRVYVFVAPVRGWLLSQDGARAVGFDNRAYTELRFQDGEVVGSHYEWLDNTKNGRGLIEAGDGGLAILGVTNWPGISTTYVFLARPHAGPDGGVEFTALPHLDPEKAPMDEVRVRGYWVYLNGTRKDELNVFDPRTLTVLGTRALSEPPCGANPYMRHIKLTSDGDRLYMVEQVILPPDAGVTEHWARVVTELDEILSPDAGAP